MEEAHRKVLKKCKPELYKNLILETSILDELEQENILKENHVNKIQVQETNEEKISKLLYILARRGPRAFEVFVEATRKDHPFVAEMLERALNEELEIVDAVPPVRSVSSSDVSMRSARSRPSSDGNLDINKNELIQTDMTMSSLGSENSNFLRSVLVQQNLNSLYTKLKAHMTSSMRRELSFRSPVPVSFQMINDLIDDLLKSEEKCYKILGMKDKSSSLLSQIQRIIAINQSQKAELESKEEQRNQYCNKYIKLETKCRDISCTMEALTKDKKKLKEKADELQAHNSLLSESLGKKEEEVEAMSNYCDDVSQELMRTTTELEALRKKYDSLVNQFNRCTCSTSKVASLQSMVVASRSPVRVRRSEQTPTYKSRHWESAVNPKLPKREENDEPDIIQSRDMRQADEVDNRRESMVTQSDETGFESMALNYGRHSRKQKMTPRTTPINPANTRAKATKTVPPLEMLTITNSGSMPVASSLTLSHRSSLKHPKKVNRTRSKQDKTQRNFNL